MEDYAARVSAEKQQLFAAQGGRCWLCGKEMAFQFDGHDPYCATYEHVVPVVDGGGHDLENLRLSHKLCNSIRGNGRLTLRFARLLLEIGTWPAEALYPPDQDRSLLLDLRRKRTPRLQAPPLQPFTSQWLRAKGYI
jgi:HNH endonuclease